VLTLLSIHEATLLVLHWAKKLDDPFNPEALSKIRGNKESKESKELWRDYLLFQWFLKNAIDAEELPALVKPLKKPEEKKMFAAVDVPQDIRARMPKQYTYWIT